MSVSLPAAAARASAALAAGLAIAAAALPPATATAQDTGRCCQGDCGMRPAGKISVVHTDPTPTETCRGDFGQEVPSGSVMGQSALMMSNNKLFLPALGVVVDTLDAEADGEVQLKSGCGGDGDDATLAVLGKADAAAGMGHGGCR